MIAGRRIAYASIKAGRLFLTLSLLAAMTGSVHAQAAQQARIAQPADAESRQPAILISSQYHTPRRGSEERRAIMDAARVPVSAAIGKTVIFTVSVLRSDGDWAYLQAEPRNPDGSALDWSGTRFAEDWAMDAMSDVIMVLLRRSGDGYQVVDYVIGPTDVHWYGWLDQYGLPEALFYGG